MHISEATLSALSARGWTIEGSRAWKKVHAAAFAGTLSNGDRIVHLSFCPAGRWLTVEDGFATAFELDSRDYVGRPNRFAKVIDDRVQAHFRP